MNRIRRVRLKIERAHKHINDLDVAIREFSDSKPYTIGAKDHREIPQKILYVSEIGEITEHIYSITGDAIHNLRSSLDHLAWQLVEAGGGRPNCDTAFPICEQPGENGAQQYSSAIGKGEIKKMTPAALKILEALQPY